MSDEQTDEQPKNAFLEIVVPYDDVIVDVTSFTKVRDGKAYRLLHILVDDKKVFPQHFDVWLEGAEQFMCVRAVSGREGQVRRYRLAPDKKGDSISGWVPEVHNDQLVYDVVFGKVTIFAKLLVDYNNLPKNVAFPPLEEMRLLPDS